jgi:PLP dependent protein
MVGTSVAHNLSKIEERISAACARAQRPRSSVRLLAVSKLHSIDKIREAYAAGQRDFAENYAQEAMDKQKLVKDLPDLIWHFIGRIQSNKVKSLAGHFSLIHSVESLKVADFFNRNSIGVPQKILLQYNVAGEASKGGADLAALFQTVIGTTEHENIRVHGLMVMPPLTENAETVRPYFKQAREVLQKIRDRLGPETLGRHPLNELSMGTSQDFEVAIEEGATLIRLGTDVFGAREKEV